MRVSALCHRQRALYRACRGDVAGAYTGAAGHGVGERLEKRVLVDGDGTEETLSASEFDLLKVFAENPNRPLARDWLLETIGHREMEVFDRAMDLRITRIRR